MSSLARKITLVSCQRILSIKSCRTAEPLGPGSSRETSTDSIRHRKPYTIHHTQDTRYQTQPASPLSPSCWPAEPPGPGSSRETSTDSTGHKIPEIRHQILDIRRHQLSLCLPHVGLQSLLTPGSSRETSQDSSHQTQLDNKHQTPHMTQ